MLPLLKKTKIIGLGLAAIAFAWILPSPNRTLAQERNPAVARISFVSGPVTYSRGDDPNQWDDAIENVPVTIGDRIYSPEGGRVELQLSSGNFVRLAPRSYFSTLNLSDDVKQFYLGEGVATFNIRRLPSNEVIEIDTPNVSVTLDEPGNYRISVDENGDSRVIARRGRVTVAASGRQIAVENSEMRVFGVDSPRYEIVGLPATDAFDRWVSERDSRFDHSYSDAYRYASDDIIGVEDLSDSGRWEQIPEYGYAWTPASVAAGWVPFSAGRWFWQDPWGWTWISNDRWGWATSHYGRWTQYRSRWYWVPVRPRTRVIYAPAVVEFVRVRDHVGWFPLHPRDRYVPWWDRRERDRFDRNITYVNRNYVTIVNQNTFISARPVNRYIVRDAVVVRDLRAVRLANVDLPVPTRSSLRVISETGGHRGLRPSANVLNRAAVVRTAPPLPPPTFQEKLPRIEKARGKPIEPAEAATLTSAADTRAERVRIRAAAEETRGREFAARNPSAGGPAPQAITGARGKRLAREEAAARQSMPADQNIGSAAKTEALRQDRQQELENRRQEQQKEQQSKAQAKQEQAQQRQQELQERQAEKQREIEQRQQQKEQERQSQLQKQQQTQERRQEAQPPRASREQQRLEELERQQTQREEQRKAQAIQQQEREQARRQQEQERQARQQQDLQRRQQEQDRDAQARQQQQQREQARQQQLQERQARQQQDLQRQQQQQEQARREQARQQQLQERQAQQQRQQDSERRQQQREQERNAQQQRQQDQIRSQQLRQQQAQQQRQVQQQQRQQEQQERRQQSRQQPQQERQSRQPRLPQPDQS